MTFRAEHLEDLAREERDGTGPEHARVSMADWTSQGDAGPGDAHRLSLKASEAPRRAPTFCGQRSYDSDAAGGDRPARPAAPPYRIAGPERHGELLRAAHRQMPVPVGRLLLAGAAIVAVAAGFSWCVVYLAGVAL